MAIFPAETRERLKSDLLQRAHADARLSGAAITGSAAVGTADRWSDIDLAFGVADPVRVNEVLSDFSEFVYSRGALHHYDLRAGAWIYRVFFLPGGLQVDLAFVPRDEFRPLGPAFQLAFGSANPARPFPEPNPLDLAGWAWLHALHARSSILRGKLWQAEYMISAVRDHTLTLACLRSGLPSAHAKGVDSLPEEITRPLLESMIGRLDADELWRAFGAVLRAFTSEVTLADPAFGQRVTAEIRELAVQPED